jgi:hypothetical protein
MTKYKKVRDEYFNELLGKYSRIDNSFCNKKQYTETDLTVGDGYPTYFSFRFDATRNGQDVVPPYISVEFGTYNTKFYEILEENKNSIEDEFGRECKLDWRRNYGEYKFHVIQFLKPYEDNLNLRDEAEWNKLIEFHCKYMPKLKAVVLKYLD